MSRGGGSKNVYMYRAADQLYLYCLRQSSHDVIVKLARLHELREGPTDARLSKLHAMTARVPCKELRTGSAAAAVAPATWAVERVLLRSLHGCACATVAATWTRDIRRMGGR